MPKLKCDAKKCIYNCERYCVKSVIHVNDDLDSKKCISFSEQKYENKNKTQQKPPNTYFWSGGFLWQN